MSCNTYSIQGLIQKLQAAQDKLGPSILVMLAHEQHTYDIVDIMVNETRPEAEHTCDEMCICPEEATVALDDCPFCNCAGCADDELVEEEQTIFITLGEQFAYALPHLEDF